MTKIILIEILKNNGWKFKQHGGNHDIWIKGTEKIILPQHSALNSKLVSTLIKKHELI